MAESRRDSYGYGDGDRRDYRNAGPSHLKRHANAYLLGGMAAAAAAGVATARNLKKSTNNDGYGREDDDRYKDDRYQQRQSRPHIPQGRPPLADRNDRRNSFHLNDHKLLATAALGTAVGSIPVVQKVSKGRRSREDDSESDEDPDERSFFGKHKMATTAILGTAVGGAIVAQKKARKHRAQQTNEPSEMGNTHGYGNKLIEAPRPLRPSNRRHSSSFSGTSSTGGTYAPSNSGSDYGGRRDSSFARDNFSSPESYRRRRSIQPSDHDYYAPPPQVHREKVTISYR